MNPTPKKKRTSREDREALDRLIRKGIVSPDKPGKKKTDYSVRIIPDGGYESDTYPGFTDHPSTQGIEYSKHIDQSPTATVWEAQANLLYAEGGFPSWVRTQVSDLDIAVWWQMVHYQFVNDNNAYMSVRTLSRNLARPYRSIQRSVSRLLEIGLIIQTRKNSGRKSCAYKVVMPSSIEPRALAPRRSDSGFNKNIARVEVTAESVEVTAENSRGVRAVSQKTKPLKGVVSEHGASAPVATTTQRHRAVGEIRTIDELRDSRTLERNKLEYSQRPATFRRFHKWEVTPSVLRDLIENSPTLHETHDRVFDRDKRFGSFNEALGACESGPWSSQPDTVIKAMSEKLSSKKYDIRQLPKALESELNALLHEVSLNAHHVKTSYETWETNQAKEKAREARTIHDDLEKEKARLAIELQLFKIQSEKLLALAVLRDKLVELLPDIFTEVEIWGTANCISYHSGRTNGVYEIEQKLQVALADFKGVKAWNLIAPIEQSLLLESWLSDSCEDKYLSK